MTSQSVLYISTGSGNFSIGPFEDDQEMYAWKYMHFSHINWVNGNILILDYDTYFTPAPGSELKYRLLTRGAGQDWRDWSVVDGTVFNAVRDRAVVTRKELDCFYYTLHQIDSPSITGFCLMGPFFSAYDADTQSNLAEYHLHTGEEVIPVRSVRHWTRLIPSALHLALPEDDYLDDDFVDIFGLALLSPMSHMAWSRIQNTTP